MIERLIWTPMSSVLKKADKLNLSLPLSLSHNVLDNYPTIPNFVTEMCTHVHISFTKWCIVGNGTSVFSGMGLVHCGICATGLWQGKYEGHKVRIINPLSPRRNGGQIVDGIFE